jgi:hypothetical protein
MSESKILVMTPDEFKGYLDEAARAAVAAMNVSNAQPAKEPKRFVYGLRGIRELFNVSHPTAQKYKNTWLAPAIEQRGRKIIVDAARAIELFNANLNV